MSRSHCKKYGFVPLTQGERQELREKNKAAQKKRAAALQRCSREIAIWKAALAIFERSERGALR